MTNPFFIFLVLGWNRWSKPSMNTSTQRQSHIHLRLQSQPQCVEYIFYHIEHNMLNLCLSKCYISWISQMVCHKFPLSTTHCFSCHVFLFVLPFAFVWFLSCLPQMCTPIWCNSVICIHSCTYFNQLNNTKCMLLKNRIGPCWVFVCTI